ncbi:MAG TPA: cytochrome c biogenesis protein CcdA [Ilumatobacter sp.]|nr:cytochrome c biogenesis protein CcdA [Ilumatobacter sp.]
MLEGPFAYALLLGMVATLNPCGFALLPAYLAAFVGLDDAAGERTWLARWGTVGRALTVAAALTAGFVTVFGVFGAVISKLIDDTTRVLPWVTIAVGLMMIVLGAYLLTGRSVTLALPKLQRGGADGTYWSMYLFGVSYALASLSCTISIFLGATTLAFREGSYASMLIVFVMYGLGMGVVVGVLTVAVALARTGLVAKFRSLVPMINRFAGGLLVVAGAYAAYYGWYERRVYSSSSLVRDPIVDTALDVRTWLVALLPDERGAVWWAVAAGVALAGFVAWNVRRTRSETARGS